MQQLEVHVAVLGFDVLTEVPRGKTVGKKLVHDFVVLRATSQLMTRQEDQATAQFERCLMFPEFFPEEAGGDLGIGSG